jgi:DNA-binding PadR family transcriptional regulator
MSEARLLSLVARYPHRRALARHARDGSFFPTLRRLEAHGAIRRQRELYRLTRRGREQLDATRSVALLVVRSRLVAQAPTSSLNAGSSRIGSKSESPFA